MELAEATKVKGLVMTSSPRPQPSWRTPSCSAAVPRETATASSTPRYSAKARSKRSPIGPSESRPERRTSSTSSSSRAPISGLASGIGSNSLIAGPHSLKCVLQRVDQRLPGSLDHVPGNAGRPPLAAVAVGGVEQHPGDRAGATILVEDPHLVVGQLDLVEVGVAARGG